MKSISKKGSRRLRILSSLAGGGLCAISLAMVLVFYGMPYDPIWWLVMALIILASFVVPCFFVRPIEWVIEGYLADQ
ncbi:MAG: hypothetical protein O7I42_10875 [Alphaproteobacteria bacterium]|nr:hypothetical protein [Alphaproteobacteria bacterium]